MDDVDDRPVTAGATALTLRDVVRMGAGLCVVCRSCGTARMPILDNVAARIGLDRPIDARVPFLCSGCGGRDTSVRLVPLISRSDSDHDGL